MPVADADLESPPVGPSGYAQLPFPPLKKSHILHCSVHHWYPKYRSLTPKARLLPLPDSFVEYLKSDGIVLPPDESDGTEEDDVEFESDLARTSTSQTDIADASDEEQDESEDETDSDPSQKWSEIHASIKQTIAEFGGKVAPKLNWSAPKDATWINPSNSMECRSANDVYLMLKSSDFVTHDLEHWDDDCESGFHSDINSETGLNAKPDDLHNKGVDIQPPYHLFLRKFVQINPSVEFRCFVRHRHLIAICQRDVNHFDFLFPMVPQLRSLIQDFFDEKLKRTFPDEHFVFDVYIPGKGQQQKVWLIDVNPWAKRTDPLLFSWLELLTMDGPDRPGSMDDSLEQLELNDQSGEDEMDSFVRIPFRARTEGEDASQMADVPPEDDVEELFTPEFRLIKKDDPEAYSFNTPQYSAHKLPKDVVEASESGPGPLREFAEQWKEMLAQEQNRR